MNKAISKKVYLERLSKRQPHKFAKNDYGGLPAIFNIAENIPIVCPEHGSFEQRAESHLYATSNCKTCSMLSRAAKQTGPRFTTEDWIQRARKVHGDKYTYERTEYKGKRQPVTITCPDHGDFTYSMAGNFTRSNAGCPTCKGRLTQDEFLRRARALHGDRYDYSNIQYVNSTTKVEVICPDHGSFWPEPYAHCGKKASTCRKCADENHRSSQDAFIEKARTVHGDRYDYSKVDYQGDRKFVAIVCPIHGDFQQKPCIHLMGSGCKRCARDKSKTGKEEFIQNARKIHGDKYDYSKVVYKTSKTKVEVICPEHGSFWVKPNSHVSSRAGCTVCSGSKGEQAVAMVLTKLGIEYRREHVFKGTSYRYDFYLPAHDILIEFHGAQHFWPVDFFGGVDGLMDTQRRDREKVDLARTLELDLIILRYNHLNENILEDVLKRKLKNFRKYWFNDNGKVVAFKSVRDVCNFYKVPGNLPLVDLEDYLTSKHGNLEVLF